MLVLFAQDVAVETPEIAWSLLMPLVIMALGGIGLVTITSVVPRLRGDGFPAAFTAGVAVAAGGSLIPIWSRVTDLTLADSGPQLLVAGAMRADAFTVFVTGVIAASVFLAALLLNDYLVREDLDGPEWYVLLLMSASGGIILASAEDLIVTFVGLEILSIAVYVLASMHLRKVDSQEAGIKYFMLGALSSALFLYGIALIYGATGSTSLTGIAAVSQNDPVSGPILNPAGLTPLEDSSMILVGMALLLVGFGFKVSAVPFHMWTPDVYEGSPTPVVAYMASGVKVAGFAGMVRVLWIALGAYVSDWQPLIYALAILSLVVGSLLALAQSNVKRMLAYSSITHVGFMLVAVYSAASTGTDGIASLLFYLLAYTFMVGGTFGVATVMGRRGDSRHGLSDYEGLARKSPILAGMMSILLFSQAGVPFTSGFLAKFRVILAAADSRAYALAGVAMLAAAVAAVLYLRIVVSMFLVNPVPVAHAASDADLDEAAGEAVESDDDVIDVPPAAYLAIGLATIVTLILGLAPFWGDTILARAAEALTAAS